MQIALAQLPAQLAKGLKPLYVLHGDEALLQQEAADAIRAAARAAGHTERSVHVAQGAHVKWHEILAAGQEMSLFADRQLVELKIPGGKPGKDGSVALQRLAAQAQGNTDVLYLVTLPRLDFATLKSAWFAALDGAGLSIKIDPIERRQLPAWIGERLKAAGLGLAPGDAGQRALQFFADRVEGNLLAAHQEVSKLALLHGQAGQQVLLSAEQIEQSVLNVARFDVFKLTESVLAGQVLRVQRMLDGLRAEGEAEVLVHYALAEEIRNLRRAKLAMADGKPLALALRELRVWGVREQLYERVVPRIQPSVLADLLQAAQAVDGQVKGLRKTGWPVGGWASLQQLALQLTRACA